MSIFPDKWFFSLALGLVIGFLNNAHHLMLGLGGPVWNLFFAASKWLIDISTARSHFEAATHNRPTVLWHQILQYVFCNISLINHRYINIYCHYICCHFEAIHNRPAVLWHQMSSAQIYSHMAGESQHMFSKSKAPWIHLDAKIAVNIVSLAAIFNNSCTSYKSRI